MSWSHRNKKGNSNCSVMRMQSKAMRITNRYDTIQGGSVWVSFHQCRIQRTGFLHDYNWRLQSLSFQCCKRDICDPTIRVHNPTRGAEMSMKGVKVSTSALYRNENLMDDGLDCRVR